MKPWQRFVKLFESLYIWEMEDKLNSFLRSLEVHEHGIDALEYSAFSDNVGRIIYTALVRYTIRDADETV